MLAIPLVESFDGENKGLGVVESCMLDTQNAIQKAVIKTWGNNNIFVAMTDCNRLWGCAYLNIKRD